MLLLLIDPARQNKKKHLPGMQNRFHVDSGFIYEDIQAFLNISFADTCSQADYSHRQFTKFGLGLAAFSQVARNVFAPSTDGQAPKEGGDIWRVGIRRHGDYWGLNNEGG
jgi:hypothetical protein